MHTGVPYALRMTNAERGDCDCDGSVDGQLVGEFDGGAGLSNLRSMQNGISKLFHKF